VILNLGRIGTALAEEAELQDTFVGLLAAKEVRGDTRILFDLRAAVVFGVVAGVVAGLRSLLLGRRRSWLWWRAWVEHDQHP
jgi:hypothetical protein